MQGFICSNRVYEYKGTTFEMPRGTGTPWPLKKDGELRERAGKKFLDLVTEFCRLPEDEQEKHRIGGGCIKI